MKLFMALVAILLCSRFANAQRKTVALSELAENAVRQSKLTVDGGPAFHLKATILDTTNPKSDYRAQIEEYWTSPTKWRRTVELPSFSQTLIVNGNSTFEHDAGDYYPWWLSDLVTAIFDPLPMRDQLTRLQTQVTAPSAPDHSSSCADFKSKTGRAVFCFEGSHGLLKSVFTQVGYEADFKDFKEFGKQIIARRIVLDPEPGVTIEARITDLEELKDTDDSLFVVPQPTPQEARLKTVKVDEATARGLLLTNPDIAWPSVGDGLTSGRCAVYVVIDRQGKVREAWPQGCDNPGLQDPLRDQVRKWEFKQAADHGVPLQIESLLTFAFQTTFASAKTKPILSDAEARKLATYTVEAAFKTGVGPSGQAIRVRISVNTRGQIIGTSNPDNLPAATFLAAMSATDQWMFRPYLKDGIPVAFDADILFPAPKK